MTYREDDAAMLARRERLAHAIDRDELDDDARDEAERELAAIDTARIEAARKRLPAVARARIASPCSERWDTMLGEGAVRSCSRCEKEVFDLSQMTLAQAEVLLSARATGGRCVRVYRRRDGTMMFADCVVGSRGVVKRRLAVVGAAVIAAGAALAIDHDRAIAAPELPPPHATPEQLRRVGEAVLGAPRPTDADAVARHLAYPARGSWAQQSIDEQLGTFSFDPATVCLLGAVTWDGGVRVGHVVADDGSHASGIRRALRRRGPRIRAAYRHELGRRVAFPGHLTLQFTVARTGRPAFVEATESRGVPRSMVDYVIETVADIRVRTELRSSARYEVRVTFTPDR